MAPNLGFNITPDDIDRFPELLAPSGVIVSDEFRNVREDLSRGTTTHSLAGKLQFRGQVFPYRREKDDKRAHVSITFIGKDSEMVNALLDVLDKLFPEPERGLPEPLSKDEDPRYKEPGCFVALFVVSALVFFLFLGIRTFLRWF